MTTVIGKPKPRTFTEAEQIIEYISNCIFASGLTYAEIGQDTELSPTTIAKIASRDTRWPRPRTFFALLIYFNIELSLSGGVPTKREIAAGKARQVHPYAQASASSAAVH